MRNNIKWPSICVIRALEEGKKNTTDQGKRILEEIKADNFPKVINDNRPESHKGQSPPGRSKTKNKLPGHIIFNLLKTKKKEKSWWQPEKKSHYMQRNKGKNVTRCVVKNYVNQKTIKWHIKNVERKKNAVTWRTIVQLFKIVLQMSFKNEGTVDLKANKNWKN